MNFIYFICPEVPQYAKYCEGFYNFLTYGYRTWSHDRYVSSSTADKKGRSRLLTNKLSPKFEEMKAGDFVLDRIYQKVITSDCYSHSYEQISKDDVAKSEVIVFLTSNSKPIKPPSYLSSEFNKIITWKMSNIFNDTDAKYNLLESLVRRIAQPKN